MDTTLFIKNTDTDMIIVQIYVDDIIFGATNPNLCKEFEHLMQGEFEMSMVGELRYFLGSTLGRWMKASSLTKRST